MAALDADDVQFIVDNLEEAQSEVEQALDVMRQRADSISGESVAGMTHAIEGPLYDIRMRLQALGLPS